MTPRAGRLVVAAIAVAAMCGVAAPAIATPATSHAQSYAWLAGPGHHTHRGTGGEADVNVCSTDQRPGFAQCAARIRTDLLDDAQPQAAGPAAISGYSPAYLQSAYNAPSATAGAGRTVAIVDAYDAPFVAADLAVYRATFGLSACTVVGGCFTKVNQTGNGNLLSLPAADATWAQETTLDVEMVSALCPNCKILLVEANSNSLSDLGAAVDTAVGLGADVVSNSYGAPEFSGETSVDHFFDHPGVAIVASSGDKGYGVNYPAASRRVVAVGGTSLHQTTTNGTRNATETVWSGAGSGCSAYEPKPAWQSDTGCPRRTVADVSAVADPSTGVSVYNSTDGGWEVFGGTSVAAPIVGALYALAGNTAPNADMSEVPYTAPSAFNDVVSGSNGRCGGGYLCTGRAGYDGPTGLGTPNTVAGLTADGPLFTPLPANFSAAANGPARSFRPGQKTTGTVTITPRYGFTGDVALSATAKPAGGLSIGFAPPTVVVHGATVRSKLTFSAKHGGRYVVTITAKHGAMVHRTTARVVVNDFAMKATPAKVTVVRGERARFTLKLTPRGGLHGRVKLSMSGLPARDRVVYAHNPAAASSSQTIVITTSVADAPGRVTLRITGAYGVLRHRVTVILTRK